MGIRGRRDPRTAGSSSLATRSSPDRSDEPTCRVVTWRRSSDRFETSSSAFLTERRSIQATASLRRLVRSVVRTRSFADDQLDPADSNPVTVARHGTLLDARTIQERAVGAIEIDDLDFRCAGSEPAVNARHERRVDNEVGAGCASGGSHASRKYPEGQGRIRPFGSLQNPHRFTTLRLNGCYGGATGVLRVLRSAPGVLRSAPGCW